MLAHQGGWDEILLVVGPLLVVFMLLRLARRRIAKISTGESEPVDVGTD